MLGGVVLGLFPDAASRGGLGVIAGGIVPALYVLGSRRPGESDEEGGVTPARDGILLPAAGIGKRMGGLESDTAKFRP